MTHEKCCCFIWLSSTPPVDGPDLGFGDVSMVQAIGTANLFSFRESFGCRDFLLLLLLLFLPPLYLFKNQPTYVHGIILSWHMQALS